MSRIRKLKIEQLLPRLKEIARTATMEHAQFGGLAIDPSTFPKTQKEVNGFIKGETKLWRNSWIVDPLKDIIDKLEEEVKR